MTVSTLIRQPRHRSYFAAFFAVLCVYGALPETARADISIPPLTSAVIDDAAFFDAAQEQQLNSVLRALFQAGGPQMQVWTIRTLEGEPIENASIRAVDIWKLGREGKDDGVLLSIARDEKRFRLEVGRGLEGVIPDALAARILKTQLVPALRRNLPSAGVELVIQEVAKLTLDPAALENASELSRPVRTQKPAGGFGVPGFILLLFLFALFNGLAGRGLRHSGRTPRRWGGGGWSGGGGGGWSGGGGGGWSGGGGGFSGGGASGGW